MVVALAGVGAPAQAATTPGVGTTTVTSKLVDLNIAAGLLHLSVFTDQGSANIDSKAGPSAAKNTLTPLTLSSTLTDLSGINKALGAIAAPVSAQSPPDQTVNTSVVDFSKTAVASVLGGQLEPINLATALSTVKGATSGLTAALTNLNVLSGVAGVTTLANQDALSAASNAAAAARNFKLGSIPVLNLGAILKGLGIDPAKLPLTTAAALLDKLNVSVPALAGITNPLTTLTGLVGLQSAAASSGSSTPISVPSVLAKAINTLDSAANLNANGDNPVASDLQKILATVQTNLKAATLLDMLSSLLNSLLPNALNTPLLEIDTGAIQVITKAAATVADSTATVTAANPTLKALGLSVPGVDQLVSTLQSVLKTINQSLAGLISVNLLDKSASVTGPTNGYIDALAQASEFKLTIDPSKVGLSAILSGLPAISKVTASDNPDPSKTAVGSLLGSLNVANPFASLVNAKLLSTDAPLALGATTLSLGQVTSESKYTLVPVTPAAPAQPSQTLPKTGRELGPWAAMAAVLIALSLAARRWLGRARVTG